MKLTSALLNLLCGFFLVLTGGLNAQTYTTTTQTEDGYVYETVDGDPTQTRIYKLKNGLTVYLSVYRDRPQIFTLIPVRAGSKNDPADNTGLAHYLEHMVFKGTSRIGANLYDKEKVLLDSIEMLFNQYRKIKDPVKRKALYKKIDQVSYRASRLCYANEYDKLVGSLGAQGTNAFTSNEQTVYMNNIPANQLEKWLVIEKERFSMLVPRLFHTELEAVYEEKNMSLDRDEEKVQETLYSNLFKKHPYGTQTTIGTISHLKNPSITEIKKYFNTYYVPNNMAICLAGDLDPNRTIRLIDSIMGPMQPKPVPVFAAPKEEPILQPVIKRVIGPSEENVVVGFRLPGKGTREALLAGLVDQMLSNSQAGLIDLNLNQTQKVLDAGCYFDAMNDYSVHQLYGSPREGQSLAQVRKLLLDQLDSLKQGRFGDWLIPAIVNNIQIDQLRTFDNNQGRAFAQMDNFISGLPWASEWKEIAELKTVTKAEVMEFVKKYYQNNYVSVEKVVGKDPNVIKISKPAITPAALNKDGKSAFFQTMDKLKSPQIEPQFLDFSKDLSVKEWKPGIEMLYKKNTSTPLFQMSYVFDFGNFHDKKLEAATRLLDLAGAGAMDGNAFKKELFKLGSEIGVSSNGEQTTLTMRGLQENFDATVGLAEQLLRNPNASEADLSALVQGILKERENQKLDKGALLNYGLAYYARFGSESPARYVLKNTELKNLKTNDLLSVTKSLANLPHKILYYGPADEDQISVRMNQLHPIPATFAQAPEKKVFTPLPTDSNKVYWIDYDMVQTELLFVSRSVLQDTALLVPAYLYNEYMGGNMSSVVFQELRESKALAYGANAGYQLAQEKGKFNFITGFIGCQADKLPEALNSMYDLIQNPPLKESSLNLSKESILSTLRSERTTKSAVFNAFLSARKQGMKSDYRKILYQNLPGTGMTELKKFQDQYISGRKFTLVLIGKRDKIRFDKLKQFGSVTELKADQVFGY